jgi:hypothetical protein
MTQRSCLAVFLSLALLSFACDSRSAQPLSPSAPGSAVADAVAGSVERVVTLFDACDPQTFNQALGAGTCTRSGGVTFQNFLDQLRTHHSIGAWHFAPGVLTMKVGQTLVAINRGGEAHTFTEVEEFGGGKVQDLNNLIGLTEVAPECLQSQDIAPGARSTDVEDESGVEKYQCCIHPWMRAEIRIADK